MRNFFSNSRWLWRGGTKSKCSQSENSQQPVWKLMSHAKNIYNRDWTPTLKHWWWVGNWNSWPLLSDLRAATISRTLWCNCLSTELYRNEFVYQEQQREVACHFARHCRHSLPGGGRNPMAGHSMLFWSYWLTIHDCNESLVLLYWLTVHGYTELLYMIELTHHTWLQWLTGDIVLMYIVILTYCTWLHWLTVHIVLTVYGCNWLTVHAHPDSLYKTAMTHW